MNALKYYYITKINFKNSFAYITDSLGSSVFIGIIIFIFIQLWQTIYTMSGVELISGFTLAMMVWYLVMTEAIVTAQGKVIVEIGEEVKSGNIANYLNKPYNYLLYKYFSTLGSTSAQFASNFMVGGIVALVLIGSIQTPLYLIPFVLITAFTAMALHFTMMAFLGVTAFWLEESRAMDFIYSKLIFTIGGMLVPLEIFPLWLSSFAQWFPFSYVAYHPAKLFVMFSFEYFFQIITVQLIWIAVIGTCAMVLFNFLIKRVSVNGG
jgi:ABC-2 type transport system permease protein